MTAVQKRPPGRPCDEALQERRREAILKVTATMFARHGFTATDVQWIADKLKVSKGTVYRYFPSKEKLFLAAVERGVRQLHEHIESAKRGLSDPIEEIRAAVTAYLQFFKENPQLVELFVQERSEFREKHRPLYFQHREAKRGPWRQRIADLMAQGRIRQMPVERVMDALSDMLYGTMFTNHFAGRQKPFEAQAQDVLDVLFNGILHDKERADAVNGRNQNGKNHGNR
jgi:AcrR family transcriptional regulator